MEWHDGKFVNVKRNMGEIVNAEKEAITTSAQQGITQPIKLNSKRGETIIRINYEIEISGVITMNSDTITREDIK